MNWKTKELQQLPTFKLVQQKSEHPLVCMTNFWLSQMNALVQLFQATLKWALNWLVKNDPNLDACKQIDDITFKKRMDLLIKICRDDLETILWEDIEFNFNYIELFWIVSEIIDENIDNILSKWINKQKVHWYFESKWIIWKDFANDYWKWIVWYLVQILKWSASMLADENIENANSINEQARCPTMMKALEYLSWVWLQWIEIREICTELRKILKWVMTKNLWIENEYLVIVHNAIESILQRNLTQVLKYFQHVADVNKEILNKANIVIKIDRNWVMLWINKEAFWYSPEEIIWKNISFLSYSKVSRIMQDKDSDNFASYSVIDFWLDFQASMCNQAWCSVIKFIWKDWKYHYLKAIANTQNATDWSNHYVFALNDVTIIEEVKKDMEKSKRDLEAMIRNTPSAIRRTQKVRFSDHIHWKLERADTYRELWYVYTITNVSPWLCDMLWFTENELIWMDIFNPKLINDEDLMIVVANINQRWQWKVNTYKINLLRKNWERFHAEFQVIQEDSDTLITTIVDVWKIVFDTKTWLWNLEKLTSDLPQIEALITRLWFTISAIYLDLEDFKMINDTFNHKIWDSVLISVAERLKKIFRDTDFKYRQWWDEFLVIVIREWHVVDPESIVKRLLDELCKPIIVEWHEFCLRTRIWIDTFWPDDIKEIENRLTFQKRHNEWLWTITEQVKLSKEKVIDLINACINHADVVAWWAVKENISKEINDKLIREVVMLYINKYINNYRYRLHLKINRWEEIDLDWVQRQIISFTNKTIRYFENKISWFRNNLNHNDFVEELKLASERFTNDYPKTWRDRSSIDSTWNHELDILINNAQNQAAILVWNLISRQGAYLIWVYKPWEEISSNWIRRTVEEQRLQQRNKELTDMFQYRDLMNKRLLELIWLIAERKENIKWDHAAKVAHYSKLLAIECWLDKEECVNIYFAAYVHDLWKITIWDSILYKTGELTSEELGIIKSHTTEWSKILTEKEFQWEIFDLSRIAMETHHERWDWRWYPKWIKWKQIPLIGRIIAITDTFDALTSWKYYWDKWAHQDPYSPEEAMQIIIWEKWKQFDPNLVGSFANILPEIIEVKKWIEEWRISKINTLTQF